MRIIILLLVLGYCTFATAQQRDNKSVGFVYFEDNFDWLTPEVGYTEDAGMVVKRALVDYVGSAMSGKHLAKDTYTMTWNDKKALPQNRELFINSGWTNIKTQIPNGKWYGTPIRVNQGAIFLEGDMRVNQRTSNIESPSLCKRDEDTKYPTIPAQAGIEVGKSVDVVVTITATALWDKRNSKESKWVKSLDYMTITVVNDGTIENSSDKSTTVQIGAWNQWKEMKFNVFGATCDTKIIISTHNWTPNPSEYTPNSLYISGMKVERAKMSKR